MGGVGLCRESLKSIKKKIRIWYLQSQKDILRDGEIKDMSHLQYPCAYSTPTIGQSWESAGVRVVMDG